MLSRNLIGVALAAVSFALTLALMGCTSPVDSSAPPSGAADEEEPAATATAGALPAAMEFTFEADGANAMSARLQGLQGYDGEFTAPALAGSLRVWTMRDPDRADLQLVVEDFRLDLIDIPIAFETLRGALRGSALVQPEAAQARLAAMGEGIWHARIDLPIEFRASLELGAAAPVELRPLVLPAMPFDLWIRNDGEAAGGTVFALEMDGMLPGTAWSWPEVLTIEDLQVRLAAEIVR